MLTVENIMTKNVTSINHSTLISEVEGLFVTHNISGAPIVDNLNQLVGFVSKSDITRFDSLGEDSSYARVSEIANPNVITIPSTATLENAAQLMLKKHTHHLVVIDNYKIVGVLSSLDFVMLIAKNFNKMKKTL